MKTTKETQYARMTGQHHNARVSSIVGAVQAQRAPNK